MADPRIIKGMAIGVASIGFALPSSHALADQRPDAARAGKTAPGPSPLEDIALSNGTLTGRVVDRGGTPLEGARVSLHQGKQLLAEAITDKSGVYSFKNLRGGLYRVTSADSQRSIRVWKDNTAPPNAKTLALLVTGQNATRGQMAVLAPANLLMAGGTASAATVGAIALSGSNSSSPMMSNSSTNGMSSTNLSSSQNQNSPSQNSSGQNQNSSNSNSFAAPQQNSPQNSLPVGGNSSDPSEASDARIRGGLLNGDDSLPYKDNQFPKVVICPAPISP